MLRAYENAFGRLSILAANPAAQWLDPGEPRPQDDRWPRSGILPGVSTERLVRVILPKDGQPASGDQLWILFIPGAAAENGWEDHPETISQSAFVQCRVIGCEGQILRTGAVWTWLRVTVCDVIPFLELAQRCPAQRMAHLETWGHSRGALIRKDGWELLWAPGDDAGHWLLARPESQEVAVLAGGEWLLDYELAWAGHVILPIAAWQSICAQDI
jgi:hypothetical protein